MLQPSETRHTHRFEKCQKIVKNELIIISQINGFFDPTNSPKSKNVQFTILEDNKQIYTLRWWNL